MRNLLIMAIMWGTLFALHANDIKGTYNRDSGLPEQIIITKDTLTIFATEYAADYSSLYPAAKCEMTNLERNFYQIQSYESPILEALKGIDVSREYCDTIAAGTVLIDVLLPNHTVNSNLQIELSVNTKSIDTKIITNGSARFTLNLDSELGDGAFGKDIYFQISPLEYVISMMPYLYFGNLYIPFSINSDIVKDKYNKLTLRLPNMCSDIFMKYDITGDIIYCDGQCVKWRGRTYLKHND